MKIRVKPTVISSNRQLKQYVMCFVNIIVLFTGSELQTTAAYKKADVTPKYKRDYRQFDLKTIIRQ